MPQIHSVLLCALLAAAACAPPSQAQHPVHAPPAAGSMDTQAAPVPKFAVLRPDFLTRDGAFSAGTAFVVDLKVGQRLLLTAQHLFGPSGGLEREIAWADMPGFVTAVRATSPDNPSIVAAGGQPMAIEGASALSEACVSCDIAAFRVTSVDGAGVLTLADTAPAPGARVYLLAEVIGAGQRRLHPAVVAQIGDDYLVYRFDEVLELRATSGAAVVDAQGRVVAINLAGGPGDDGRVIGIGGSVPGFRPRLERALANTAP